MDFSNTQAVARICERIAAKAALDYLQTHGLEADRAALVECVMSWIKAKLPEAINDALDAFSVPGMERVGEATFAATMMQAGIEAAKEAGFPKGGR